MSLILSFVSVNDEHFHGILNLYKFVKKLLCVYYAGPT